MQALKEVALRLLNVYVSPYVENLNAEDLSLSVFGGMSAVFTANCPS
jgi:vacuolar protein sorting-associated protein 13A/C